MEERRIRGDAAHHSSRIYEVAAQENVKLIAGWPTDTISINHFDCEANKRPNKDAEDVFSTGSIVPPHTVLLFVPGNPGFCGWYKKLLVQICQRMGPGYAARAVSHAGHGIHDETVHGRSGKRSDKYNGRQKTSVTQTVRKVEGQLRHKLEWMDLILKEMKCFEGKGHRPAVTRFIFLTHSFGAHLVQRLCVRRRDDILCRTALILHLMPFLRFDPPACRRAHMLTRVAHSPRMSLATIQTISRFANALPRAWVDKIMKGAGKIHDDVDRALAVSLIQNPTMATHFLTLGMEEMRDAVPKDYDEEAMRTIGNYCRTVMLFGGGVATSDIDHWGPYYHILDLDDLKRADKIPAHSVHATHIPGIVHDFVVRPNMLPPVVEFCINAIQSHHNQAAMLDTGDRPTTGVEGAQFFRSKL